MSAPHQVPGQNGVLKHIDRATLALREAAGLPTTGGRLLPKPPPEAQKPVNMMLPKTPLPLNQMGRLSRGGRKLPQIPVTAAGRNAATMGGTTSTLTNIFGFAKKITGTAHATNGTAAGLQMAHAPPPQPHMYQQNFMPGIPQQQPFGHQMMPQQQQQQQPQQPKKLLPFSFGFGNKQTQQQPAVQSQQQQQRVFETAPPLAMRTAQSMMNFGGVNTATGRRPGRGAKLPQPPAGAIPGGGMIPNGGLAFNNTAPPRRRQLPDRGGLQTRSMDSDYGAVPGPFQQQQQQPQRPMTLDTVVEAGRGVRKLPVPMVRTGTVNGGGSGLLPATATTVGNIGAPTPFEQMLLNNSNIDLAAGGGLTPLQQPPPQMLPTGDGINMPAWT